MYCCFSVVGYCWFCVGEFFCVCGGWYDCCLVLGLVMGCLLFEYGV